MRDKSKQMELDDTFQLLLNSIPEEQPIAPTFLEIAGFPHYENVCSNILRFYLNPNNSNNGLNALLIASLLECCNQNTSPFTDYKNLQITRELTTRNGRIDLILYTDKWVIAIENKIFHWLANNLEEYSTYVENSFPNRKILKIVLSIKNESTNLSGGFVNVTYEQLFRQVETKMQQHPPVNNDYTIFFRHFTETINKFYMNVQLSDDQIAFLRDNQNKIEYILELQSKMALYISQRAKRIHDKVKEPIGMGKWIYAGYDVGFHYTYIANGEKVQFKIECPLDVQGIIISICVEQNKIDKQQLERLDFFKKNKLEEFESSGNRVILEKGIPFSIDDDTLIERIENILADIKISE